MFRGRRRAYAAVAAILPFVAATCLARADAIQARSEAYLGGPFGVACVEVDLPASEAPQPLGWRGLGIAEKRHRALYPAVDGESFAGILKDVLRDSRRPAARILGRVIEDRGKARIYFLFLGQEPLELTIQSQVRRHVGVTPVEDQVGRKRLLAAWWRHYTAGPGLFRGKPSYPPLVENYLRAMLAKRLGLELAERPRGQSWQEDVARELSLVAGTESLRLDVERQRFFRAPAAGESADRPPPSPIESEPSPVPEPDANATVEPLALRVPAEWFYMRFGSFANFLWFQDTLERFGGDFQNLLGSRGLDRGTRERFETQLAAQTTVLSRFFGDAVVADVAIVGTDLFLLEGGAYGLLFQARSGPLLSKNFADQRAEWKQKIPDTTDTQVMIGDRTVSLLASRDGRVRSYYVVDGDYHFITTSKALVGRFLAVRSGAGSLGQSREFRYARTRMPTGRGDTVFVCLSSGFFRNLLSPQYRVEMMRRLEAVADIDLVQMAVLTSATEGKPGATIGDLVAGGFLPPGFGARPDGSRTVLAGGEARDSLRGAQGAFVPIPDIPIERVTRSEAAAYQQLATTYRTRWTDLDSLFAGIRRRALDKDRERVIVDLHATPLAKRHLDVASRFLGPADKRRVTPVAENALAFEMVLPQQRVFGGLERVGPGIDILGGMALPIGRLRNVLIGHLGTTDEVGILGGLAFRPVGPPDADGFTQGERGLWRRTVAPFTVFSFQRDVLERATSQLRLEDAGREAQLRFYAGDLSKSSLAPLVNAWGFSRTRQTALGNIDLLHQIAEQLHVPGDAARTAAELLLSARLVCPLGGQYVYRQTPEGSGYWTSTALEGTGHPSLLKPQVPESYQVPPLNWFRGLEADAALADASLEAHIELDVEWPKTTPKAGKTPE